MYSTASSIKRFGSDRQTTPQLEEAIVDIIHGDGSASVSCNVLQSRRCVQSTSHERMLSPVCDVCGKTLKSITSLCTRS